MNFNIYRISSKTQPELNYIGSTKKSLEERMKEHLAQYLQYTNGNGSYCSSFDVIQTGDIKIEFLESTTQEQRYIREGVYIKLLKSVNSCCNKKIAGRSQKQWQEQNKDRMKETQKQWRYNNPNYHKNYYKKLKNQDKTVINIQELNIIVDNMVVS